MGPSALRALSCRGPPVQIRSHASYTDGICVLANLRFAGLGAHPPTMPVLSTRQHPRTIPFERYATSDEYDRTAVIVNTAKAPAARAAHTRCAPRSRCSLRCLRRLRRPRGCPFESHPHRTAPHLTPPQPRRPPFGRPTPARDRRSLWQPALRAGDLARAPRGRLKTAARRRAPPRSHL